MGAGKELARHIEYENLEPWPLKFVEGDRQFWSLGACSRFCSTESSLGGESGGKPPQSKSCGRTALRVFYWVFLPVGNSAKSGLFVS